MTSAGVLRCAGPRSGARHPGFVLAYVLEGAVVTKISDQGEEKT